MGTKKMETIIQLKIDESLLLSLKKKKEDFVNDMLFYNALMLYRKKMLSLGKAAQLAGYDKIDFINKLRLENEPVFDYDTEDMIDVEKDSIEASNIISRLSDK